MSDIRIITYPGVVRESIYDAIVFDATVGASGILYGCTVTKADATSITIDPGFGIIKGRLFVIEEPVSKPITAAKNTTNIYGQVLISLNLATGTDPLSFSITDAGDYTSSADSLTHTTNENINFKGGDAHQMQLATFKCSKSGLTSVTQTIGGSETGKLLNSDKIQDLMQYQEDTTWKEESYDDTTTGSQLKIRGTCYRRYTQYISEYDFCMANDSGKDITNTRLLWAHVTGTKNLNQGIIVHPASGAPTVVPVNLSSASLDITGTIPAGAYIQGHIVLLTVPNSNRSAAPSVAS